jgi:glyoxylate reductase
VTVGRPHAVLVTRPLPDPGATPLVEAGLDVEQHTVDAPLPAGELATLVAGKDALLCMLSDRIDGALLDAAGPSLRVVANFAVGFDNIDVPAATARGVLVTNTPDVLTDATADLAWTLLMAAARRVIEGDTLVRQGRWVGWTPTQLLGAPVAGRTLGIFGMGKIGRAVATRASGFGMRVVYHNRSRDPEAERSVGASYVTLDELLAESDFLSLHAPLNEASRHVIDAAALAKMRPTAILVNTARGPLIDERALVEALRDGTIAAAGLDVFEAEPTLAPGLTELDNVVLLPHLGSATTDARAAMAQLCCDNILAVLDGRRPVTPLNPEVLDH